MILNESHIAKIVASLHKQNFEFALNDKEMVSVHVSNIGEIEDQDPIIEFKEESPSDPLEEVDVIGYFDQIAEDAIQVFQDHMKNKFLFHSNADDSIIDLQTLIDQKVLYWIEIPPELAHTISNGCYPCREVTASPADSKDIQHVILYGDPKFSSIAILSDDGEHYITCSPRNSG